MNPSSLFRRFVPALVLLATLTTATRAQEPKVGREYYEDNVKLGFKIKTPKDWSQIPPQPGDPHMIVKYEAALNNTMSIGSKNLKINTYLLVFDGREEARLAEEEGSDDSESVSDKGLTHEWINKNHTYGKSWNLVDEDDPQPLKVKGVEKAETFVYEAVIDAESGLTVNMYVCEYTLEPHLVVSFLGNGPGNKKWRGYERTLQKLAKSFSRVEVEALASVSADADPRDKKRAKLQAEVQSFSEWNLHETENYFIVTDSDDKQRIEELMVRIEAIRNVYVEQYPPEQARAINDLKEGDDDKKEGKEEEAIPVDPLEKSRTSVLRVCSSKELYHKYGGPSGSAGYWNSRDEELVIYLGSSGGISDTWITMNHEAFHQYIFYFYGSLAPHSWYNEGTGDFYSGYEYKHRRFNLKENSWRIRTIQQSLRGGDYCPLEDFVRWSKSDYYGQNDLGLSGGENYAQGWSFIYFLRTGAKEKPKGWDRQWEGILDTYLETLATSGDLDEAVDAAFAGVNYKDMEESWIAYTLSL